LELDGFNTHFVKDLLIHEAHRHPYLDRLAKLYLLQWRHNFANPACSAWRHVLVLSLFPWVRKYRVHSGVRIFQALQTKSEDNDDAVDDNQDVLVTVPIAWVDDAGMIDV